MKAAVTALAIGLAALGTDVKAQQITGAGATFPAPVYAKWSEAAKGDPGRTQLSGDRLRRRTKPDP